MIDLTGSYCGDAPVPDTLAWRWNGDPFVVCVLAVLLFATLRLAPGRRSCGVAGVAALAFAFLSPLCAASVALFSARALHHLVIVAVAAPMLALAWPPRRLPPAVPALVLATATLWLWHVPAAYDAALANRALYWLMQLTLLGSAWLYWAATLHAQPSVAAVAIAGGGAQMGMLGALLTFAPRPLYASHLATTVPFGIAPLADQQLAGLVMWVVGLVPYALAAGWMMRRGWRRASAA